MIAALAPMANTVLLDTIVRPSIYFCATHYIK